MQKPFVIALAMLWTAVAIATAQEGAAVGQVTDETKKNFITQMFEAPPEKRVSLLGIAVGHRMYPSGQALKLAQRVVAQEDIQADDRLYAQAMLHLSACHSGRGQSVDALACARQAGLVAASIEDAELIFKAACQESVVARETGGVSTALVNLEGVRKQLEELNARRFIAPCLNLMGLLAEQGGSVARATLFYSEAFEEATKNEDLKSAVRAQRNLGAMLTRTGQLDKGLTLLEAALALSKKKGAAGSQSSVRLGIAENKLARGNAEGALADLRALQQQPDTRHDKGRLAVSQELAARALVELKRYKAAEAEVKAAMELVAPRQRSYFQLQTTRSRILCGLGKHAEALQQIDEVLAETKDGLKPLYIAAAKVRARVFQERGDHEEAHAALQHAMQFESELRQQGSANEIQIALSMAELADEQRAAQSRERTNKILMYTAIALGILGVLIAFFFARLSLHRRLAEREREATKVLAERTQEMNSQLEVELGEKTAKLRAEMENRANLERALQQARQIEAVGTLTSGVAHDFNNLMTVVLSSNETLRITAGDRLEPRELMALDESTQAAKSGAIITQQLLEMARSKPSHPTRTKVKALIEKIQGLLRRTMGNQIDLEIHYEDSDAAVFVDSTRLTTALINLCCNARDALSHQGIVRLTVRTGMAGDYDFAMAVESMHPRTQLVFLEVSDGGCGMSPEELARAKDPLFTTKPESQGTGLGLSVVQGFAEDTGGLLHLESAIGTGTRATIVLPLCTLGEVVTSTDVDKALIAETEGLSVVVLDDERAVLSSVSRALLMLGCSVDRYSEIDKVREHLVHLGQPDIVLADIRIPGHSDGLDLARWIRLQHPSVGVVLMTGCSQEFGSEFATLSKPFSMQELAETLAAETQQRAAAMDSGMLTANNRGSLGS